MVMIIIMIVMMTMTEDDDDGLHFIDGKTGPEIPRAHTFESQAPMKSSFHYKQKSVKSVNAWIISQSQVPDISTICTSIVESRGFYRSSCQPENR